MSRKVFSKQLLATSIAMAVSTAAMAQEQDSASYQEEELVVTGIRASLKRSMDLKRDAQGVVDAISAEDIGKFPDTNLAESLQRITGVSIDRRDGEGSKVTVRGLGPEFNLVTLNGRQMPGATIEDTVASGSRSFDFANLASEGVSSVEVYKTSRASVTPGGIGATINIVTPKPLDDPGLKASISGKGVYDQSSDDPSMTPEISGIYSQTFFDDKFGVALTGSYQDRQGGQKTAQVGGGGWYSVAGTVVQDWGTPGANAWGGVDFLNGDRFQNQPAPEDVYSTPQQMGYSFSEFERTRTNGQLTLQYEPVDTVQMTLDYTYSENEITNEYYDVGAWFGFGGQAGIYTDHASPAVQTPEIYSEDTSPDDVTPGTGDLTFGAGRTSRLYENKSVGFNIEWQATDTLSFALDYHDSSAEARPNSDLGSRVGIAVSAYVRDQSSLNTRGDMPVLYLDIANGEGGTDLRPEDLMVSGSFFSNSQMRHEVSQLQLSGEWEFSDDASLLFGVASTEAQYRSGFGNVQRDSWGGLGEPGMMPSEWFTVDTIMDKFEASKGGTTEEEMAFLGASDYNPWNQHFVYDFDTVRNFAAQNLDDGGGAGNCADGSTYYCTKTSDNLDEYFDADETSQSVYVQLNWDTELFGMGTQVYAGLRYESTEVETPAITQEYSPVRWETINEFYMDPVGQAQQVSDSGSYDYLLPSIDASFDVAENMIVRASYSRTLARPGWKEILGGESYSQRLNADGGDGSRGNPGLKPFVSDNIDLSFEWYYGDASYMSVGYFTKNVENFIGSVLVTEQPLPDVVTPIGGPRYQAALDSGLTPNQGAEIKQYILDNFASDDYAYVDGDNIIINGIPGEDPAAPFNMQLRVNNDESVRYDGWEFAVQHAFGESGFGLIANYTIVDSNTEFDNMLLDEPQFAVTGQSDSANLIGFYDKYGFQARIAYNWRDAFLQNTATANGNNPTYVDDYSQVDINVSYDITENFSVFAEGLNVTEEYGRTYGRSEQEVIAVYEGGARYNLGARYTF